MHFEFRLKLQAPSLARPCYSSSALKSAFTQPHASGEPIQARFASFQVVFSTHPNELFYGELPRGRALNVPLFAALLSPLPFPSVR